MQLVSADTPLYGHPLTHLETWLRNQGCEQDRTELHHWTVSRATWRADLWLETDQLVVRYASKTSEDIMRTFKYSLSRQDIEDAVFSGP